MKRWSKSRSTSLSYLLCSLLIITLRAKALVDEETVVRISTITSSVSPSLTGTWVSARIDAVRAKGRSAGLLEFTPHELFTIDEQENYNSQIALAQRLSSSVGDKSTKVSDKHPEMPFNNYVHYSHPSDSGTRIRRNISHASVPTWKTTYLDTAYTIDGDQLTFTTYLLAIGAMTTIRAEAACLCYAAKRTTTAGVPTTDCTNPPHPIPEKYSINEIRIDK